MSDNTDRANPSIGDALRAMVRSAIAGVHTLLPAKVVSYDPARERVTVQPLLQRVFSRRDGSEEAVTLPPIEDAPVAWMRAGGWVIKAELAPGDLVAVLVAERSLELWLEAEDQRIPIDPGDVRMHDISDAVVVPGILPYTSAGTAALTLGRDGTTPYIRLQADGTIDLAAGGEADQHLVRGEDLVAWLNSHTHPTAWGPSGAPVEPVPSGALSSKARVR